ncbi:MAG TPA: hypothetical protein VJL57_03685 [Candidatus Paceibacterota bacterium]
MVKNILWIGAAIWSIVLVTERKKAITDPNAKLSTLDHVQVLITTFFAPILAGCIFYFGWRQQLPQMARRALILAIIAVSIQIALGILLFYLLIQPN